MSYLLSENTVPNAGKTLLGTSFTLKTCLVFNKIGAFIQESKNSNSNRL